MVKKKAKSSKSSRKRDSSWQAEDVQVHTALPPQVEGQLRCFCRLSINQILWSTAPPHTITHVRAKWWGEDGEGSIFRPLDVKRVGDKSQAKTTARYPVRSGPKQFAAYLTDMGSLSLEVLSGPKMLPIGNCAVVQIGLLSPNRPINGFFPVFSPKDEKIAEIQVSVVLESLMASYDSSGSIPTTDLSMETRATHDSTYPQRVQPMPYAKQPQKPLEDPFISPASQPNTSMKTSHLRENDPDVRQKLDYSFQDGGKGQLAKYDGRTVSITENGDVITTNRLPQSSPKIFRQTPEISIVNGDPVHPDKASTAAGSDLLSVLLDRGNKLRENMILSSLQCGAERSKQPLSLPDFPAELEIQDTNLSGLSKRSESTGSLLKEILNAEAEVHDADGSDKEYKAVDLVMGSLVPDNLQMLMGLDGSRHSSLSSDMDIASDPGDPIHNESILQELFYKNMASDVSGLSELSGNEDITKTKNADVSLSVDDPGNMRPPSRHSSMSSLNMLEFPEPEPEPEPEKKLMPKKKSVAKPKPLKRTSRIKLRRKKSKRHGSRSSMSDMSDSDVPSTPRSEMSRVSFDMYPSDIEEPVREPRKKKKKTVDGLSVERLTLLGRVHVSRVSIDLLQLVDSSKENSFSKKKSKVKTGSKIRSSPKMSPKAKKSCTYFIEYQFPVVACSRDKFAPNAMATEVMRVVSKHVKDGVVTFNHRSVFPILFDGTSVEKWWRSALIFKLFSRSPGQKVPVLIGSCGIPLKSILKSESFHLERSLSVMDSSKNGSFNSSVLSSGSQDGLVGTLKVSVELASDSKDFATALAKTKMAEVSGKARIVPILQPSPPPQVPPSPSSGSKPPLPPEPIHYTEPQVPHHIQVLQQDTAMQRNDANIESHQLRDANTTSKIQTHPQQLYQHSVISNSNQFPQTVRNEPLTLHMMLLIPEGRNISLQGIPSLQMVRRHPVFPSAPTAQAVEGEKARDLGTRNTYLVCRMFWCSDAVHSDVNWGTIDPQFNFMQMAPVMMSQSLLERMRNNFMIIELWDKKTTAENDKLIGIVKLSLHQFYMSFRDRKIAMTLLRSQFPVISVDNYVPVVDVFSGAQHGQLKVLLAMGSSEQVTALQRIKTDGRLQPPGPERPNSYLERSHVYNTDDGATKLGTECIVEHVFEIIIDGVQGLQFENMIWGEADCFVQYSFLSQNTQTDASREALPVLKSFRSATTLCIPDPALNDITRHRIILSQGTPVQRELLTACAGVGGGGVPFEVWCRYYHPNVRDQCIAKATLPLAKLCAMITMQKKGESSVQTFSLPLTQIAVDDYKTDEEAEAKRKQSGLIEVTINYKQHLIQAENAAAIKNLSGAQVCISVAIQRASGLKSAAEAVAHLDSGMQYPAEVGVNSYVRVKLSFLGKKDERITRTVARAFSPEFSHHMDFPCPLLWAEADTSALCLAEILETAEVTLELWHQVPGMSLGDLVQDEIVTGSDDVTGRRLVHKTGDVLLGMSTLPLAALLTHRTGISGWFPLNLPSAGWSKESKPDSSEEMEKKGLERVGGGLELSIKFAHLDDRERVINAGRGVGWSPMDIDVEQEEWESEDENTNRYHHVHVIIDHIMFPLLNALLTGQTTLDKAARCYIRYKFYDKAAVISKLVAVRLNDSSYLQCELDHKHDMNIPDSSPYKWYLREDRLEVQVWLSYSRKKEHQQRPHQRDKLIGSAFIDLEALNDSRRKQHRISGLYPLFKPGTASLGGAYIQAHVSSKPHFGVVQKDKNVDEMDVPSSDQEMDADYDPEDSFHQLKTKRMTKSNSGHLEKVAEDIDLEASFPVHITIERAMHLPYIDDKVRSDEYPPCSYVSYQAAEGVAPSYTEVFPNSSDPVWDYEIETRLSTQLLYEENKNLVLKVWHKPTTASKSPDKSSDRVLGFVSVDLTPLASGLYQICGWYNITDFNGQCRGQIKVSVVPLEPVSQYGVVLTTPSSLGQPHSLPTAPTVQGLFLPPPMSLPVLDQPFSTSPHFEEHYESVKRHHELLTQQVKEHIHRLTHNSDLGVCAEEPPAVPPSNQQPVYWTPTFPQPQIEESSSSSILFSSLRKQMQGLDDMMYKFKNKLNSSPGQEVPQDVHVNHVPAPSVQPFGHYSLPVSRQSGPLTSTLSSTFVIGQNESGLPRTSQPEVLNSAVSTISSIETNRSQRDTPREHEISENSNSDALLRNVVDSGAYSLGQSTDKDQDGSDTQRSCSDKMDTFRLGTTPRDFIGQAETDSGYNFGSTPRDGPNDSNNSIYQLGSTPKEEEIPAMMMGYNVGFSASDTASLGFTPRDIAFTPRENNGSISSIRENGGPASFMLENLPQMQTASRNNVNFSDSNLEQRVANTRSNGERKEMSIIQEFTETDHTESEAEADEFYHKYRAALTEEDETETSGSDLEEGDIVVPRTLNSMSGIFRCSIGNNSDGPFMDNIENLLENEGDKKSPTSNGITEITSQKFTTSNLYVNNVGELDLEMNAQNGYSEQFGDLKPQFSQERDTVSGNHEQNQDQLFDRDVDPGKPTKTLLSNVDLDMNSEMNTQTINMEDLDLNSEFLNHNGRMEKHLLSNVDFDSVTSGSVAFQRSDSESGSRVSSAGSRRNQVRTLSEQSAESLRKVEESEPTRNYDSEHIIQESQPQRNNPSECSKLMVLGPSQHENTESTHTSNHNLVNVNGEFPVENGWGESESDEEEQRPQSGDCNAKSKPMPNFFLPVKHLEESMRALKMATTAFTQHSEQPEDPQRSQAKTQARANIAQKLTGTNQVTRLNGPMVRPLPTAEEAKRIAKIFSGKFK